MNNNIYHSNKREPAPSFLSDNSTWPRSGPFWWQNPCCGYNSGTDLVVALEYIFFNFVPTTSKSLQFTRFRKSYRNLTAVILTNHCQSYTAFLLDVRCSKWPRSFSFCSWLTQMIVYLRNLFLMSTRVTRMLLTPGWVNRRRDVKQLSINISILTIEVKHSISRRTTFSRYRYLAEEETLECLLILQQ